MNDIEKRDIETYLRILISETFDSQSDTNKSPGRQKGGKASKTSTRNSDPPEATQ
jgi:hypothetical protein